MSDAESMPTHTMLVSTYTLSAINVEARGLRPHSAIRARYPDFETNTDLVLVRRGRGARFVDSDVQWAVIRHNHGYSEGAREWMSSATLAGLYQQAVELAGENNRYAQRVVVWLRGVLVSLFDQSDPTEAAEQMLVAMGAPLDNPPRAAY